MKAAAAWTLGSLRTMFAAARCFSAIASKPMSCAASVKTRSWPVSVLGRKPLGMPENSQPVMTKMPANRIKTTRRCSIDQRSVTS